MNVDHKLCHVTSSLYICSFITFFIKKDTISTVWQYIMRNNTYVQIVKIEYILLIDY